MHKLLKFKKTTTVSQVTKETTDPPQISTSIDFLEPKIFFLYVHPQVLKASSITIHSFRRSCAFSNMDIWTESAVSIHPLKHFG